MFSPPQKADKLTFAEYTEAFISANKGPEKISNNEPQAVIPTQSSANSQGGLKEVRTSFFEFSACGKSFQEFEFPFQVFNLLLQLF